MSLEIVRKPRQIFPETLVSNLFCLVSLNEIRAEFIGTYLFKLVKALAETQSKPHANNLDEIFSTATINCIGFYRILHSKIIATLKQ